MIQDKEEFLSGHAARAKSSQRVFSRLFHPYLFLSADNVEMIPWLFHKNFSPLRNVLIITILININCDVR